MSYVEGVVGICGGGVRGGEVEAGASVGEAEMNPLAAINKNLRELEKAWGKIKSPETLDKAREAWHATHKRVCPVREPEGRVGVWTDTALSEASGGGGATVTLGGDQNAPASVSVGSGFVSREEWKDGVTTVYPRDYKPFVDEGERGPGVCEHEIEGDLEGSGTFVVETVVPSVPEPQWIGGWPEYAFIEVVGLFPNRRSLKGTIGDGRTVHVERRMDWKPGRIKGRLVRAGAAPLYRCMT